VLAKARVPLLRTVFSLVIAALAVEMIVNGATGRFSH
jgi:small neutral amino acid transporter SnatA (MarC family)